MNIQRGELRLDIGKILLKEMSLLIVSVGPFPLLIPDQCSVWGEKVSVHIFVSFNASVLYLSLNSLKNRQKCMLSIWNSQLS